VQIEGDEAPALALLARAVERATARAESLCRRVFQPMMDTRVSDAPSAAVLTGPWTHAPYNTLPYAPLAPSFNLGRLTLSTGLVAIPDLQAAPPPTITAFGTLLTAGDFQLLAYTDDAGRPAGHYLLRVAGGYPVPWYYTNLAGGAQPYGAIRVTGLFGYDSTVPPDVLQYVEMLAVRLYTAGRRGYGRPSGNTLQGGSTSLDSLDSDIREWLTPYTANAADAGLAI